MTSTDYTCKICGTNRVAYYDESCPINQIEAWKSALTCDRCYAFRDSYIRSKNAIIGVCYLLNNFRESARYSEEKKKALRDAEIKIRERITTHTRRVASLLSDYYRIENTWDIDFVFQIMEKPMHSLKTIDAYHAGVKRLAKQ